MNYLTATIEKIYEAKTAKELNEIKFVVNYPATKWSDEDKKTINDLIDQLLENLIHNVAGALAMLYVNYLAKHAIEATHAYYKDNFKSEYISRVRLMGENSDLIDTLNQYNSFYKETISETTSQKRKFPY